MRLDPETNIWAAKLEELSGYDKGRIYAQRANHLIAAALNDPKKYAQLFRNGRVRRTMLASLVGCNRSVFIDNPQVVTLLETVEGRSPGPLSIASSPIPPELSDAEESPPLPAVVQSVLTRLKQGAVIGGRDHPDRIVLTDRSCRIDKQRYELPTIIWSCGIEEEASDWLRDLVIKNAATTSSAKQYAKIIRAFLRYCRDRNRAWHAVDDNFLVAWRNGRRGKVDDQQVISDLNIVFQFYVWAETTGLLSLHVGIYDKEEMPAGFKRGDFPISARRKISKRGAQTGWATTLSFRASRAIEGRRNTPTDAQAMSVHEQLLKGVHGERDALIASWAEEAGPRRFEILQLRLRDLPTHDELIRFIEAEENVEIAISRRKRGSKAPLSVNPYLIIETRNWIEGGRRKIVEECRQRLVGYREAAEIFISSKTGKVLAPDSVTRLMGEAFKAAGVEKASLHRLRAKAIVEAIELLVDGFFESNVVVEPGSQWAETILVLVAEKHGQASALSLRPYLNFVLNRRLSVTEAARRKRFAEKTRHLERRAASAHAELQKHGELIAAMRLSKKGDDADAAEMLRRLAEKLGRNLGETSGTEID